jgi:hypothetical protein
MIRVLAIDAVMFVKSVPSRFVPVRVAFIIPETPLGMREVSKKASFRVFGVVPVSDSSTVPFAYVQLSVYAWLLSLFSLHIIVAVAISVGWYWSLSIFTVHVAETKLVASMINAIRLIVSFLFFHVFFN